MESNNVGSGGRWWLTAYTSTRWWVGVFVLWTVFGVLMAGHVQVRFGGRPGFVTHLLSIVPFYWAWVPMTPLIVQIAEGFDFGKGRRIASIGGHLAGGVAVIVAHSLLYSVYRAIVPLGETGGFVTVVLRTIPRHAAGDFTTYAVLAGGALGLHQYRRGQEREREAARTALRAARLEAQLSSARLDALQMQLHPHFLFNALNTISVLVLKGAGTGAIRAIRQLADLLRVALHSAGTPERPLEEEIAFVGRYLAIEKLRFGDGLRFDVEVARDAATALVPHLILQPLIENAVIHGLRSRIQGGRIRVVASRDDDTLRLEVWDDGAGLTDGGRNLSEGVGLTNTRARLEELYGQCARLSITAAEGGGTVAAIHLPYHTDAVGVVA